MNFIKNAIQFFREAYYELTKVTWLGKKEVVGTTFIVVIFVIIMSLYVSAVDMILGRIIGIIL
ncbi:MAG: preprotein translocase subunit SecE [Endomicrobia bacterium]|jgi:preprotein translocase subunit SecE|nr:preprotein translocase subunit SecE [Endomicrobiia bacterium]